MVELSTRKREIRGDGGNHHEKLGLREFRVWVNWPSPIRQERVPIRRLITPIRGLPNPIRQVVPLISHIRSYPPYRSHLHPPSLSFSSTTQPSSQNTNLIHPSLSLHAIIISWHQVQHTPSTAYTEYSIHRVQHTQSTASTHDCLSSLHSHDYELTPECSFSFQRTSLHDSHGWELTNWWIESQHPVHHPSTASKYLSNLALSRPPSESPHWLDYGLQVRTSMAPKCISKLDQSRPLSASLSSLDLHPQVYRWVHSISVSKCISEFTRSTSPSASETHSIKYIFKVRWPLYGDTGVTEVDRVTGSIRSRPRSITACSQSRYRVCRWVAI